MVRHGSRCVPAALAIIGLAAVRFAAAAEPVGFSVERGESRLVISAGATAVAEYVFRDERIRRPYFANVRALDGTPVTRAHPPREGVDPADHDTMHPGIWLGFGDVDGHDFWRNKGLIEHVEFIEPPAVTTAGLTFVVRNRYRAGERIVATEVCRHEIVRRPQGLRLSFDATIAPAGEAIAFGDQEEMGFGVRFAKPLRVTGGGGTILSADGRKNEREIRGTTSRWADYSGLIEGRRAGVLVMPHPQNFHAGWWHARDYGLLVANPFGREALTGGEMSRVPVEAAKPLRLRFAAFVYSVSESQPLDREAEYRAYAE